MEPLAGHRQHSGRRKEVPAVWRRPGAVPRTGKLGRVARVGRAGPAASNVPSCPRWREWGHWLSTGNQRATQWAAQSNSRRSRRCWPWRGPTAGQPGEVGRLAQGRHAPSQRAPTPHPPAHGRRVAGVSATRRKAHISSCRLRRRWPWCGPSGWPARQSGGRCKDGTRPPNAPSDPGRVYTGGGWRGWGHWLGTGNQPTKDFLRFGEALAVARSLGLATLKEWRVSRKSGIRPPCVPSPPAQMRSTRTP